MRVRHPRLSRAALGDVPPHFHHLPSSAVVGGHQRRMHFLPPGRAVRGLPCEDPHLPLAAFEAGQRGAVAAAADATGPVLA